MTNDAIAMGPWMLGAGVSYDGNGTTPAVSAAHW